MSDEHGDHSTMGQDGSSPEDAKNKFESAAKERATIADGSRSHPWLPYGKVWYFVVDEETGETFEYEGVLPERKTRCNNCGKTLL